ncbi:hypothetical protein HDU93_003476 [Gonapodya sp. JEL0774]|nr:hypothetical protein HDU93_003476 [Gonapodya sp. JEL0774]
MHVSTGLGDRTIVDSGLEAQHVDFNSIPGYIQVPEEVVDSVFSEAHKFFALPTETKMSYHIKNSKSLRGYGALLDENVDPANRGDMHESFDLGMEVAENDPDYLAGKFYGPNQWPDSKLLPTFRENLYRYYGHMRTLSKYLFRAFALALDLDETYFDNIDRGKPMGFMRILYYPPQQGVVDERQIGIGAHADYILKQDDKEALQVLNKNGEWIHAPPIAGTFIVVIDISPIFGSDAEQKDRMACEIRDAAMNVGFLYIRGHGVPEEVVEAVFSESKVFFSLDKEEKMKYHIKKSKANRGYGALLDENVDPANRGDLHESFDIAFEVPEEDPDVIAGKFYGPNVWPDASKLPSFRPALTAYYFQMLNLSKYLFRALALALKLPEFTFDGLDKGKPMALQRILFYPPQVGEVDERIIGIGAHTDCFTILRQDTNEALQVLNSKGQWIHAPPIPGTFVVVGLVSCSDAFASLTRSLPCKFENIADLLARWSNDTFKSTVHRAINRTGVARYSIPFFYNVHHDTPVDALPSCLAPGEKAKYPPTTAGEYLVSRFEDTFVSYKQQRIDVDP